MTPPDDQYTGPPRNADELFDPNVSKTDETDRFLDRVQRTADPKALKRKAISDKQRELADENDLRAVLATEAGVRFIARLIGGPCGWNLPYYNHSNSVMCEVAGRRSIAYQLEQWISDADLELWFSVRRELEKIRPKPKTSERAQKG